MQQLNDFREVGFLFGCNEAVANEKVQDDWTRCCFELGRENAFEAFGDGHQLKALNLKW